MRTNQTGAKGILLAVTLCSVSPVWAFAQSWEDTRGVQLEVEWSVGHEESGVFLDEPWMAILAANGSAFLVEKSQNSLRHFYSEGNELAQLGSAGSGPGEFSRIVSMIDAGSDSLLAYDISNGQFSAYSNQGDLMESVSAGLFGGRAIDLLHVDPTSDEWVVAYQPATLWVEPELLVHRFSQDQDMIKASVVHPSQVVDLDNPLHAFRANMLRAFRSAWMQSESSEARVVIVPELYSGQIVVVPLLTNGFGQIKAMTIPADLGPDPGFVIESPAQAPKGTKGRVLTLHLAGIGKQSSVIRVWNTQVVTLPGGRFGVSFTYADDQPPETYVDVFSLRNGFEERVRLDLDSQTGSRVRVWDADSSGRLLISFVDPEGNPVLARTTPLEL